MLKLKKPDYPVAIATKTKFEDSDEHESSSSEHVRNPKHLRFFFSFFSIENVSGSMIFKKKKLTKIFIYKALNIEKYCVFFLE